MKDVFLKNDVLANEMDHLLGGKKITISYTDDQGRTITITYEIPDKK